MTFLHRFARVLLNLLTNNPFILSVQQLPYFYENELRKDKAHFTLSEPTSKHCVQVLRMKEGEQLQITDGNGLLATATLTLAHKKHSQVNIGEITTQDPAEGKVSIAIAPTKNMNRTEWALEKLTEIGISEILLMRTQRTERMIIKEDRLRQILISAMLQSRQVFLPQLSGLLKFRAVIARSNEYTHKWIAHCRDEGPKKLIGKAGPGESHLILIGPEGDFTPEEIQGALAPENQFEPVTLGNTRLRTETAALVAGVLLKI
ncbi:RsmE family RNA methyltransferase [Arachidicoccus terrestris]|uniref:RsmE family RNA methyltransferase n=1 Tax=Arachidicoccus terrestris TaxID=2875539 RepID=UPI001CC4F78E|nr:RsmE family RNA methyltransferase [Arachidicoccus terrestris]UAY54757.1 16S rRNA (uracil(1498)-N(3))-methyltransferase [Arachidicoccus terrestris]